MLSRRESSVKHPSKDYGYGARSLVHGRAWVPPGGRMGEKGLAPRNVWLGESKGSSNAAPCMCAMSAAQPNDHRLDHLVVIMFENRSFDNLLGYLYKPGEVPTFEGVPAVAPRNPVATDAPDSAEGPVAVHPATSMASPYPDPGEEYPHVNTQLFRTVSPPSNRFVDPDDMLQPYNAPSPTGVPTMSGFVDDYVSAFRGQIGRMPTRKEYSQIMACYTPDQLPVMSGLARGFATFDHWFCEVPSQTYPNRSFFHAATSSGFVLNGHPPGKFAVKNRAKTLFNLLEEAKKSWAVYIDPAQILSATGLIHARPLAPFFADHFRTIFDFYEEARAGNLPNYAFIEPNMFHPHTDMHPHSGSRLTQVLPKPDTLIGGERLLCAVYEAVKSQPGGGGSDWSNTALLVTFDEHGGTFDHVSPPPTVAPDASSGEQDFRFDRLGIRIPTILISAWVDPMTVVTGQYQSTSVIRTVCEWWGLPGPLTKRDTNAPSFLPILSRGSLRTVAELPVVAPRTPSLLQEVESEVEKVAEDLETDLESLERDLLADALAHESSESGRPPRADASSLSHREAHEHFNRIAQSYFPGIANGRRH